MKDATSKIYAKAIYQLGQKEGVSVAQEISAVEKMLKREKKLANILLVDVFTIKERMKLVSDLANELKWSNLIKRFLLFLLQEKRFNLFFAIREEIAILDDEEKGQLRGVVEGVGDKFDPSVEKEIQSYLSLALKKKILLEYKQTKLCAGFRVTVGDYHIDASLPHQLARFKDSLLE